MRKTIFRKRLNVCLENIDHERRLKLCGDDKALINKEFDRFLSIRDWVDLAGTSGTLAPKKLDHGCEARGISKFFGAPMHQQHSRHFTAESLILSGLRGAETIILNKETADAVHEHHRNCDHL